MCCTGGVIKQKPSDVLKAIQQQQRKVDEPKPPADHPTIPQAIKEQLIINQQLLRLQKKD